MIRTLLGLFLVLVMGVVTLAACIHYEIIPWRVLGAKALAEGHKAAEQWCVATDGDCCPRIGDGTNEVSVRYVTWKECEETIGYKCVASYSWKHRRISIVIGAHKTNDALRQTMLHELGHHCGIKGHAMNPHAVMHRKTGGWTITEVDLKLFREGEGPNDE